MCDLIDLNSPDVKGSLESKLASPLIPAPRNIKSNDDKQTNTLVIEKLDCLDSNPFDRVLHETTEYVSRKGDPFEVMLQRALKSKSRKDAGCRVQSVGFTDDFTPRRRKKYLKAMNKTLDEPFIEYKADLFNKEKESAMEIVEKNFDFIENINSNVCDKNTMENDQYVPSKNHEISVMNENNCLLESSILNQSAMNDTLLEVDSKYQEYKEISIVLEKDREFTSPVRNFKSSLPQHFQHSLSQGDTRLSEKLQCPGYRRSQSISDSLRKVLESDNSTMSVLDKAYLESKQSEQSVLSTLSNVSSITRLNSVSSLSNVSSVSNGTINCAFLNSDSLRTSTERINVTENSIKIKPMRYNLSDLTERLSKLKCTNRASSVPSMIEEINKSNFKKDEDNKQITNNKLIDVDIFVPELNFNKEHDKSTTSTSSSDSVFINNNKDEKSIMNEAKALAKTFEDLARKTDSASSIDDLMSNNTLWMSELLPAFEDEAVVDNLIELPVSPEGDIKNTKNNNTKQSSENIDNVKKDSLEEAELQFTDNVSATRQIIITTLLLDLKKLVKTENNSEANKLIDNLENVLGVKYKSNTDLLTTCLNISSESHIPEKFDDKSDIAKKLRTSINKSREENGEISEEKISNNEKSLSRINHELENASQAITTYNTNNSSAKNMSCENNSKNHLNLTDSPKTELNTSCTKKNNYSDEKLAIKLLINLEKLISGQAEEETTLQLLKNIGKALNIASNNFKIEDKSQMNHEKLHSTQVTSIKTGESKYKKNSNTLIKTAHNRSFDSKSKPQEKINRRSISVSHSPTKNTLNMQIQSHKSTSEPKNLKKRFSSDPGFINTITNKKVPISEEYSMKKTETAILDTKKEKPLAITDVKSKLKKNSDVVNKRGPIKAVHPVSNMQRKVSVGKQAAPSIQTTTPPKSEKITSGNKIISSTPNSIDNTYMPKRAVKSKPVASSTPDGQQSRTSNLQFESTSTSSSKKRNFSCDISPVTMYVNSSNDEQKGSPKRINKLPTPKKCTPKRQQIDSSGIPKYLTPPRKYNSSFNMHHQSPLESPKSNKNLMSYRRYSPVCSKKNTEKILQSPLKDSNKIIDKVKPFKLISKFKRHSISDFTEKENNCA